MPRRGESNPTNHRGAIMPDIDDFLRNQAKKLREKDDAPKTRAEWEKRKESLRDKMFTAMGEFPAKPCGLEPRVLGTLKRDGYGIEKIILQTRPNIWATACAYVPDAKGRVPAVLVVHGHWPWARRDPVVQARCLGLVKLGFFVLAIDAFGAGERYTKPARGTYHGALYGSTLWPVGHTMLGMQVYDNRRAVDYLLSRPEVNGKLGITGASGGGNQSMYAGALDERINAVVPVCSVGNYQAYLKANCCVCEVLPGALTFTEEGDVLGLVAPRALLVMNASKDAIQFSPAEAAVSVGRAKEIFKLFDAQANFSHKILESTHDFNQPMREAMYGWMTLHLKGEGKGEPIAEPMHAIEKPEDLACFPNPDDRPKGFLFPPTFAYAVGKELVAKADKLVPDHPEMWETTAQMMRDELKKLVGPIPEMPKDADIEPAKGNGGLSEKLFKVRTEEGVLVEAFSMWEDDPGKERDSQGLFLQIDGKVPGIFNFNKHAFMRRFNHRSICGLRGTGKSRPERDGVAGAPDHNSAEHAMWIGTPLLYQWVADIRATIIYHREWDKSPLVLVGMGPLAIPSIVAAACFPDLIDSLILFDAPVSYLCETPYATGTLMGLLGPGILKVGDIPHLAGLIAPRRLIISGGVAMNGKKLTEKELQDAFAFTTNVYKACDVAQKLTITVETDWEKIKL
jgi:dienelactone hydrolase